MGGSLPTDGKKLGLRSLKDEVAYVRRGQKQGMSVRDPEVWDGAPRVMLMLRYGMTARNLFRTDFLPTLLREGIRLIVVCPAADDPGLKQELEPQGVELVMLPTLRKGLFERIWHMVASILAFEHPGTNQTMRVKWLHLGLVEKRWGDCLLQALAAPLFLHKVRIFRRWLTWVDFRSFSHPEIGHLFDLYRPDVFVATYTYEPDIHYVREARKRGIKTVGIVKSWDNLSSKTRIAVEPDILLVWSPEMRDEAVRLHFIPEEKIHIVGAPQFDVNADYRHHETRMEFMRKIGADPKKKLIFYPMHDSWTYSDEENIRLIHRIANQDDFPFPCHIHVRKYPKNQNDISALEVELGVTSENSGRVVDSWADRVDPSRADMEHLCELMYHADLVIHIGSTIAVDAACQNTPNIGFGLDSKNQALPWGHYARRAFQLDHNRWLVGLGGVKMVATPEELRAAMMQYLLHPETDRVGRKAVMEKIIWELDGRSGQRTAEEVLAALEQRGDSVEVQRTKVSMRPIE